MRVLPSKAWESPGHQATCHTGVSSLGRGRPGGASKGWFHGFEAKAPRGSRYADLGSYIAASYCPASPSSSLRPSGAASEARCDVLPVYRDLRQCPKGKSGAVSNVITG